MANSAFLQLANPIASQKSFLTGWRFPTNPWQFNARDGSYTTIPGFSAYTCDQTIVQAEESGQVRFRRNTSFFNVFETQTTPAGTPGRVAIIQYIDRATAAGMVSITQASARLTAAVDSGSIDFKMSILSFSTDTPPLSPITAWGLNPTFDAAFTELKSPTDSVRTVTTEFSNAQFVNFNMISIPVNDHIAIVLYSTTDLADSQTIQFGDISLVRGGLGYLSSPQTADSVLRECQFYYQHSYKKGVIPGTITSAGESNIPLHISFETAGPDSWALMAGVLSTEYVISMRDAPDHTYYCPTTGAADSVNWTWFEYDNLGAITETGSGVSLISVWQVGDADEDGIFFPRAIAGTAYGALTAPDLTNANTRGGYLTYQFQADARLGV
jgi:hypothetical protein